MNVKSLGYSLLLISVHSLIDTEVLAAGGSQVPAVICINITLFSWWQPSEIISVVTGVNNGVKSLINYTLLAKAY